MKDNTPIFYLWIYRKIRKKTKGTYITYSTILEIISRSIPWTPRSLYYPIIRDLEKYKLLKKIDRWRYEVIGSNADLLLNQYNCPI